MVSLYQKFRLAKDHYTRKLRRQVDYHLNVKHFWRVDITDQNGRRVSASNGRTEPRLLDDIISDERHIRRQKTLTESLAARQLKIYHQQNIQIYVEDSDDIYWDEIFSDL